MKKITFSTGKVMPKFWLLFCLLFINALTAQTLYSSSSSLQTALHAAAATGGTFYIKDGSYASFKVTTTLLNASSDKPIIIKPQTTGGVTFTGDSYFAFKKSSNIILEGFNFNCTGKSTIVKFEGSNNIRVTRNIFKLTISDGISSVKWVYIGGVYDDTTVPYQFLSHHNRIDHNIFKDKNLPGHYITIDGTDAKVQSQYDVIDHNYFKDNSPRATNEQESVRVGWSSMSNSSGFTTVEYNLFENCDGDPEVLSVKSCDNIIRHNTFRGNYGTLSFRHGNRNRAEGNYFFGNGRPIGTAPDGTTKLYTGGMRVYGTDHVIINNYFEGLNGTKWDAPITLTQGDAIWNTTSTTQDLTKHYRIERLLVAYNTLVNNDQGIELGFSNNGAYGQKMKEVTIANNLITSDRNSLVRVVDDKDQGSDVTWKNNLMFPTGTATLISGATSTTLANASQVVVENPNLVFNSATNTWKSSDTTPLYTNESGTINNEDIEGQSRPSISNPGADQYSLESVRYLPMTATTVGPLAYENVPLALSPITGFIIGGEAKSTVVTSNLSWTATVDNSSWLSISTTSGTGNGTIVITSEANNTGSSRTGLLTVVGLGVDPVTLAITQDGPSLALSSITALAANGESKTTAITSNVSWTASVDNYSWLSINTTAGSGNGSIVVTATKNTLTTSRTANLTVTGNSIAPTVLSITQDGAPSGATLINTGVSGSPVTATATSEQVGSGNANYAINSLDKDAATRWSDNADGGIITYDLGAAYTLESIKLATTGTSSKWYFYDVQFSTDGINYSEAVGVQSAAASSATYATFPFTNVARYVRIVGKGNNSSNYATISEIEFYGKAAVLSVISNQLSNSFEIYPNPVSHTINLYANATREASKIVVLSLDGKVLFSNNLVANDAGHYSVSSNNLSNGIYIIKILDARSVLLASKKIIVKN
ncbi:chondroitinase-B domain-containing protein [Flavobacterium algicola]|uniref:chondroitinase-B domain-containing protein n=1 Tax=Flavobacterium algicola TaxID=556529 RepID=UPI001EFD39FE|nr:chondroitinase-B domain-containing protein [Flavobacterium algicola]MCG9791786.1 discoidin domain-containing protein [Flavobacterium algicola]